MGRGITCIPKALKEKLLADIEDAIPSINDKAVDDTANEDNPKTPAVVSSTVNLSKFINSLQECE
jgi:hypothetical protein